MPHWHLVCKLDEVQEGKPLGVNVADQCIAIFRIGERCYATSDICTHEFALLSEGWQEAEVIECPLHQARFRITDGKCLGPPAETDLKVFDVKVADGDVYVSLE